MRKALFAIAVLGLCAISAFANETWVPQVEYKSVIIVGADDELGVNRMRAEVRKGITDEGLAWTELVSSPGNAFVNDGVGLRQVKARTQPQELLVIVSNTAPSEFSTYLTTDKGVVGWLMVDSQPIAVQTVSVNLDDPLSDFPRGDLVKAFVVQGSHAGYFFPGSMDFSVGRTNTGSYGAAGGLQVPQIRPEGEDECYPLYINCTSFEGNTICYCGGTAETDCCLSWTFCVGPICP